MLTGIIRDYIMSQVTRVFHIVHPSCYIYNLVNNDKKTITLYSLVCDDKERIARQIQSYVMDDCNFKYGIRHVSKIHTYKEDDKHIELYFVLVDEGNSVRTRSAIDEYTGKWVSHKNEIKEPTLIEKDARKWIDLYKEKEMWTVYDFLKCEDKHFEDIIKDFKIVDAT